MIGSEVEKERMAENNPESDINCYSIAANELPFFSHSNYDKIKI